VQLGYLLSFALKASISFLLATAVRGCRDLRFHIGRKTHRRVGRSSENHFNDSYRRAEVHFAFAQNITSFSGTAKNKVKLSPNDETPNFDYSKKFPSTQNGRCYFSIDFVCWNCVHLAIVYALHALFLLGCSRKSDPATVCSPCCA
jgi:hypothetical protein